MPLIAPKSLSGLYTFCDRIAEGSFGVIYTAIHTITNQKVAIKIMDKRKLGPDIHRVRNEVEALKQLNHRYIYKLFQVLETDSYFYLVVEYIPGGELFDYIWRMGHLKENEARQIFGDIVSAIAYVHSKGFAHRDLKPENILLDATQHVRIIDFGLCSPNSSKNMLSTFCGSLAYAAPEVLGNQEYSGSAADVWSLGVILYTLLCGELPFDPCKPEELCQKITVSHLAVSFNFQTRSFTIPTALSVPAQHLLAQLLCPDPVTRISINDLRFHPWLTAGTDTESNNLSGRSGDFPEDEVSDGCSMIPLNVQIVAEISAYTRLPKVEVARMLHKKQYDFLMATYLIMKMLYDQHGFVMGLVLKSTLTSSDQQLQQQFRRRRRPTPPPASFITTKSGSRKQADSVHLRTTASSSGGDCRSSCCRQGPPPHNNNASNAAANKENHGPLAHDNYNVDHSRKGKSVEQASTIAKASPVIATIKAHDRRRRPTTRLFDFGGSGSKGRATNPPPSTSNDHSQVIANQQPKHHLTLPMPHLAHQDGDPSSNSPSIKHEPISISGDKLPVDDNEDKREVPSDQNIRTKTSSQQQHQQQHRDRNHDDDDQNQSSTQLVLPLHAQDSSLSSDASPHNNDSSPSSSYDLHDHDDHYDYHPNLTSPSPVALARSTNLMLPPPPRHPPPISKVSAYCSEDSSLLFQHQQLPATTSLQSSTSSDSAAAAGQLIIKVNTSSSSKSTSGDDPVTAGTPSRSTANPTTTISVTLERLRKVHLTNNVLLVRRDLSPGEVFDRIAGTLRDQSYPFKIKGPGFSCVFTNDWGKTVLSFEIELVAVSNKQSPFGGIGGGHHRHSTAVANDNASSYNHHDNVIGRPSAITAPSTPVAKRGLVEPIRRRMTLKPRPTTMGLFLHKMAGSKSSKRQQQHDDNSTPQKQQLDTTTASGDATTSKRLLGVKTKRFHGDAFMYTSFCRNIINGADIRTEK